MPEFSVHVPGHPPLLLAEHRPELTLGRAPGQDIVLGDPTISRQHARLCWRGGAIWLEDLGSRHGSFRNGARVKGPERVTPGDRITLGRVEVRLEAHSPRTPGDPEATPLSLSLRDLRPWSGEDGDPGRLANWREALDILHELSLRMLQDLEPEALLDDLLDRLFRFLEASRGAVLYKDAGGVLAPLATRSRTVAPETPLALSPGTLETTLTRRVAMLLQEPLDPANEGRNGRLADSGTTSVMAVPLEHDGQVLGLFYFDAAQRGGPFTEPDLRFVASMCNLAAAKLLQQRQAAELRLREARERELKAREDEARARGEFLARLSHEVRTPMNAVLGFARLAREEDLPPGAADCLGKIERSGRTLMDLVNGILDFSKLEAGGLALEAVPFQLREVLDQTLDLFTLAAREQGLTLDLEAEGLPPWLLGDPLRLGQVLANLVGNAVKFTARGGVRVRVAPSGSGRLAFSVRDTGIGIDPLRSADLFAPYVQAAAGTARQYGGTGLGLAIARDLVAMMGGDLALDSEPGTGSTFSFTLALPLADAPAPAPEAARDLRGRRLLLVEDNALNQQLALALLTGAGARVDVAGTGAQALAMAAAGAYAAVLMDLHLPGLDGFETTRRLRAGGFRGPVLAMTARADPEAPCREAGMDGVVPKPIEPRVLFGALAAALPPLPAPLPALAGLMDVSAALARMDGRVELLLPLLRGFLDDPVDPAGIPEAMARGDRDGAVGLAHDLKGLALTLGLGRVAGAATDLEARLEAGAGWEPACDALRAAVAEFRARALETP